jgi:hypothetical protein
LFDKIKTYFLDEDGRSYYINNAGNVDKSAIPKPLELSPEGRKSISIGYERPVTDRELGVVRTFTLPTDFVRKAAKILKYITYTKGFGEKVYLLMQKLNVTVNILAITFRMQYQFLYKGQVDFTSFVDKDTRTTVTISEGGIAKQIKAKDSTVYEVDLDSDTEAILLKHDGINLYDTANFIVTPLDVTTSTDPGFLPGYVPVSMISRDGTAAGFAGFQVLGGAYNPPPKIEKAAFYTLSAMPYMRIVGSIKFRIQFSSTPAAPTQRYICCLNSSIRPGNFGTTPGITYLNPNGQAGELINNTDNIVSFDFDYTFTSSADEYFFIYAYVTGLGAPLVKQEYLESSFKVEFKSRYKTTYVKALTLSTLGKRLTKKITGSDTNIDTTFLQQHDNLVFSSGDGIRSLTGAKIKTSLKDYKDFVWCVLAASRGIENGKLIFDEFPHFLNPSNPKPLGEVAKKETYPAKDLLCSRIKVGYPVQQIDDINGKLSFHNTLYFSSPLDLEEPKDLDLVTNYIADPFYHEIIRLNLDGKITTDDKSDNDVMVFNCDKTTEVINGTDILIDTAVDGNYIFINGADDKIDLFKTKFTLSGTVSNDGVYTVKKVVPATSGFNVFVNENIVTEVIAAAQFSIEFYTLKRPAYTSFAGVPEIDSLYNIEELTPKSIFLKHAKWINSIFYPMTGQKITYESTEKNSAFERTLNGVTIKEKASYTIGPDILFKPWYFEYDTMVPVDTIEELENDINRCFSDVWYGDTYKGFTRKIGASTNDNKSQRFKMLCSPDTDLTKLIF